MVGEKSLPDCLRTIGIIKTIKCGLHLGPSYSQVQACTGKQSQLQHLRGNLIIIAYFNSIFLKIQVSTEIGDPGVFR